MPRIETPLRRYRNDARVLVDVVEKFLWRMDLPDGRFIRADNKGFWMRPSGSTGYGPPPDEWDFSKAVWEPFEQKRQDYLDRS